MGGSKGTVSCSGAGALYLRGRGGPDLPGTLMIICVLMVIAMGLFQWC